jgi:Glycosyl hydrolase family 99
LSGEPGRVRAHTARRLRRILLAGTTLAAALSMAPPTPRAQTGSTVDPIYRLRITLSTTADVERLSLRSPAVMIEAKPRRAPRGSRAGFGEFGTGPLRLVRRGKAQRAQATFIVAITPGGASSLPFLSRKAGRGRTIIEIENLNAFPGQDLRRLVHRGGGRRRFSVPTVAAARRGPVPGTEPLPPRVYAFYYLWYQLSDWSGGKPIASANVNPTPYSSDDPAVIDRHIQQARDAGIDGFLVSWQGMGSPADQNLDDLIARLPEGFSFALYLEILNPGWGSVEEVVAQIDYALDRYAGSEHYLRIGGRPAVYAFATRHVLQWPKGGLHPRHLAVWTDILGRLRELGHEAFLIGEGRHHTADNYSVFGGMHAYGTEDPSTTLAFNRQRSLIARSWAAIHGGPRRIYGASVIPGYDDRHIADRDPVYYFPRRDGALYADQWAAATQTASDQALVVSFNEWPETSNIEPNTDWGEQYLDLTALHAAAFKSSR